MFESNYIKNLITLRFQSRSLNFENLFTRKMIREWLLNSSKRLCDIVELISFSEFTMKRLKSYYHILNLLFQKTNSLQIMKTQHHRFCISKLLIKKNNNFIILLYRWTFILVNVTLTKFFISFNVFFEIFEIRSINFNEFLIFKYFI